MSTKSVFQLNHFQDQYQKLLSLEDILRDNYWKLHKEIAETPYPLAGAQMKDAARLGKLAAAVQAIREARGILGEV